MRIHVCAVARVRGGPEKLLIDEYVTRFDRVGRGLGLGPARIIEVEDRKGGGMAGEADRLRAAIPKGATVCALDERGRTLTSPEFAERMALWRDTGCSDLAFLIGGADGLDPSLRKSCDLTLSFGTMVWPHMLVRVMLSEQLYRAASILAGSPYHRA